MEVISIVIYLFVGIKFVFNNFPLTFEQALCQCVGKCMCHHVGLCFMQCDSRWWVVRWSTPLSCVAQIGRRRFHLTKNFTESLHFSRRLIALIFLIRHFFSVAGPGHFGCWGLGVDGEGHIQQPESPHKHCSRSCLHTDINR
jgi:hypothetical protein